ncbi:MAG: hypothetical protein H6807_00450 [Planctomycetes bacterium]|nr:hypothetical protein [Planctomycetota bacterium]
MKPAARNDAIFDLSPRLRLFPVVHGSVDYALALRDEMLRRDFDCVAVPLPPSFRDEVLAAIDELPRISVVTQSASDDAERQTYVPIDPCQAVIRLLRSARQRHRPCAFIDLEQRDYEASEGSYPDPYALRCLSPEQFAAALLPVVPRPPGGSSADRRQRHLAFELHKLELEHEAILAVCSILDWPWVVDAYRRRAPYPEPENYFAPIRTHPVARETLPFLLAELPFVTALYERRRREVFEEANLGIDGIKELLLESRDRHGEKKPRALRRLGMAAQAVYLQYVRNLTLLDRRLRPDLVTLVEGAKQVFGDDFALTLLETAREYEVEAPASGGPEARMGIGQIELPFEGVFEAVSRLPGEAFEWRSLALRREPEPPEKRRWEQVWDARKQCSWPPEDERIESFHTHVRQQARLLLSQDLARVEEFSSSLKDGLDMRETLRNWHTGKLYVREIPPARGDIEVVVFLFDPEAEPSRYPWRATWYAEHQEESTLVFYASDFHQDMVGPGVARARYGGAFFLFPPRPIPDIWSDPGLRRHDTLEERLLAGAFLHSSERHVAVVSPTPLKASWRRLARHYGRQPLHIPLSRFSAGLIDRLRTFHVLNGQEVRSYAAEFIRGLD